jgi:hypothetical protein
MPAALQDELMAVPGIAGAEVESESGLAGVRVQLATGADADAVGVAVRRILAEHGMRPAPTEREEAGSDGPPPPPGAPGSVVSFPRVGEHAAPDVPGESVAPRLESVAVEETPDGISVSVRATDGRRSDRMLEMGISGMDAAVTEAVAELAGARNVSLAGVAESELGGYTVITVLVAVGEHRHASGAAVQQGGRAYAVARATWVALSLDLASRPER